MADGYAPEKVLPLLTRNVARGLVLRGKGELEPGASAGLCVFDDGWDLRKGGIMMKNKTLLREGTFES